LQVRSTTQTQQRIGHGNKAYGAHQAGKSRKIDSGAQNRICCISATLIWRLVKAGEVVRLPGLCTNRGRPGDRQNVKAAAELPCFVQLNAPAVELALVQPLLAVRWGGAQGRNRRWNVSNCRGYASR
jgi:hypothetical protein